MSIKIKKQMELVDKSLAELYEYWADTDEYDLRMVERFIVRVQTLSNMYKNATEAYPIKIDDYIVRPEDVDEEIYYNTTELSVNTAYKVIHVLENGLLVLENFLCLIHPDSVIKLEGNK